MPLKKTKSGDRNKSDSFHQSRREKLLLQAGRTLNSTTDYEELIFLALRLICQAVECEAAFLFRFDDKLRSRRVRLFVEGERKLKILRKEIGQDISGWVAESQTVVILNNPESDKRFDTKFASQLRCGVKNLLAAPLFSRGRAIGVIQAMNKKEGGFNEADQDTLMGLTDQIAISIDNTQLIREARREALEKEKLFEVAAKLSAALKLEEAIELVMDSVRELVGFDAGGIFLLDDEKGKFLTVYSRGYGSEKEESLHMKIDSGLIGWVASRGETIIVPDVSRDERYVSIREETGSEMVAPLIYEGAVIGVFNLECDHVEAYDDHSVALLKAFGTQAAMVIERAKLHGQIVSSRALEEQLSIARLIQSGFLPKSDPVIKGYDISGMNIPSGEVGGDYYDFISIVDDQLGIAIADVSGKGVPAALLMASFRASLIAEIRNNFAIRTVYQKVNALMSESMEAGNYVTAVYGALDSRNHIFTFSNAGHNEPILLRTNGEIELLSGGGAPHGVIARQTFTERPISLDAGDLIIFYTDGVTEAVNPSGEMYGEERLQEKIKSISDKESSQILRDVYDDVKTFSAECGFSDDFTMVAMKRLAVKQKAKTRAK